MVERDEEKMVGTEFCGKQMQYNSSRQCLSSLKVNVTIMHVYTMQWVILLPYTDTST